MALKKNTVVLGFNQPITMKATGIIMLENWQIQANVEIVQVHKLHHYIMKQSTSNKAASMYLSIVK